MGFTKGIGVGSAFADAVMFHHNMEGPQKGLDMPVTDRHSDLISVHSGHPPVSDLWAIGTMDPPFRSSFNEKQMIAIVAIVVIAVAGIAAVALMGDDDDKKTAKTDYGSSMTVFGNANMDSVIDESDIQYVKDVIAGTAEKTAFCDANHDGEVNEKDIDYIRDLIDHKDVTKVWYVDGSGEEMSAEWPLNTFVVLSNSPQLMALAVGLDDSKIIGYTKADKIVFKSFEKAKLLSSSSLTDYTVMTSNGIPDAIITQGTPTDPVDPSVRARALFSRS